MAVSARYDLTIRQGLPLAQPFGPSSPDPVTGNLVPRDYTGYTATFTVYPPPATLESLHDTAPILSLTNASGAVELGLFDGGEFGQYGILLYLTQAQTSALEPFGRGIYNLDIIDAFGHPQLRIQGTIALEEGTRHG